MELAVAAGLTLQAIDLAVSLPVAGLASTLLIRRGTEPSELEPGDGGVSEDNPGLDVVGAPTPTPRQPIHVAWRRPPTAHHPWRRSHALDRTRR